MPDKREKAKSIQSRFLQTENGFAAGIKDGAGQIRLNKMQAVFAAVCFFISVCAAVSISLCGMSARLTEGYKSNPMGGGTLVLNINSRSSGIDIDDLTAFALENEDLFEAVVPYKTVGASELYGTSGAAVSGSTVVTDSRFFEYGAVKIESGRAFSAADNENKYALISSDLVSPLYGESNPIGQSVKINNRVYNVIGVCSGVNGCDLSGRVFVPSGAARLILSSSETGSYVFLLRGDYDAADAKISEFVKRSANKYTDEGFSTSRGYSGEGGVSAAMLTVFILLLAVSEICLVMFELFPARPVRRSGTRGFAYPFARSGFVSVAVSAIGSILGAIFGWLIALVYCSVKACAMISAGSVVFLVAAYALVPVIIAAVLAVIPSLVGTLK